MSHTLSTHVLDTTLGQPARNLKLTLKNDDGEIIAEGNTNDDGRFNDWPVNGFENGIYELTFHTGDYLHRQHGQSFYPKASVCFELSGTDAHFHVPLLVSPYSYSTYRGS
jgi:5-hydroxyisourate hydrolase